MNCSGQRPDVGPPLSDPLAVSSLGLLAVVGVGSACSCGRLMGCLGRSVPNGKRVAPLPPQPPASQPAAASSSTSAQMRQVVPPAPVHDIPAPENDTIELAVARNDVAAVTRMLEGDPADGLLHAAAESGAADVIGFLSTCAQRSNAGQMPLPQKNFRVAHLSLFGFCHVRQLRVERRLLRSTTICRRHCTQRSPMATSGPSSG